MTEPRLRSRASTRPCGGAGPTLAIALVTLVFGQDAATAGGAAAPTATAHPRIATIRVETEDIFDLSEDTNALYRTANAVHRTTRPVIVRRLLLFREGDPADPDVLAETERSLRAATPFREATVTATARPDGDADVLVRTHDRWSIRLGVGASFVGGISEARADVGDVNFLGLGKEVSATMIVGSEGHLVRGRYLDPDIVGSRIQLAADGWTSNLGAFAGASVGRPFFARETPYSWRVEARGGQAEAQYFDHGDAVASVRQEIERFAVSGGLGTGPRESVKRVEVGVGLERTWFEAPSGERALLVRWPRNRDVVDVTLRPTLDRLGRFERRERLDACGIAEDVPLGFRLDGTVGKETRTDSLGSRPEALAGCHATLAFAPRATDVAAVDAGVGVRHDGESPQREAASGFIRYYLGLQDQTLALNLDAAAVEEREDLEPQLTLGEDNGLRGYHARRFAGTGRVRANLEDRIFTPIEALSFRVGIVLFTDWGLVWGGGAGVDARPELHGSAGFGFRVFSPHFLKDQVLRLDIAFPFDPGEAPGVSVSIAVGQVFTLFRSAGDGGAGL